MERSSENVYSLSRYVCAECPSWSCERVVVLGSRPVEGDAVNELIKSRTLLLKEYTWMARAVYKCSRQDPEATYN
jgi:hypothetical protein